MWIKLQLIKENHAHSSPGPATTSTILSVSSSWVLSLSAIQPAHNTFVREKIMNPPPPSPYFVHYFSPFLHTTPSPLPLLPTIPPPHYPPPHYPLLHTTPSSTLPPPPHTTPPSSLLLILHTTPSLLHTTTPHPQHYHSPSSTLPPHYPSLLHTTTPHPPHYPSSTLPSPPHYHPSLPSFTPSHNMPPPLPTKEAHFQRGLA